MSRSRDDAYEVVTRVTASTTRTVTAAAAHDGGGGEQRRHAHGGLHQGVHEGGTGGGVGQGLTLSVLDRPGTGEPHMSAGGHGHELAP